MKKYIRIYSGALILSASLVFSVPLLAQSGSIDSSFGNLGKVITDIEGEREEAHSVAIQRDGKVVVAGYVFVEGAFYRFALVRYNINGSIDSTFGNHGTVITSIGGSIDYAYSVVIQNDGKIVVAGTAFINPNYVFALVRFNVDGSLDHTFGDQGIVTTDVGGKHDGARVLVIQTDGKIVAGGCSVTDHSYDFALVRYNVDGSVDNSFGKQGIVTEDFLADNDFIYSLAIQSDGKIVVVGDCRKANIKYFAIARYNINGSIDSTFGNSGKLTSIDNCSSGTAYSVVLQSDGKIVVAGSCIDTTRNQYWGYHNYDFTLVRFNANGSLDSTFGSQGKVTAAFDSSSSAAKSVLLQSDGRLVVIGSYDTGYGSGFCLARYNSNGSLDSTYGTQRKLTREIGNRYDNVNDATLQSDGKIVLVGSFDPGPNSKFVVVRYNP